MRSDQMNGKRRSNDLLYTGYHSHATHKRPIAQRIFVNRLLDLNKIKFYGFDMDYTLAVYKSPVYEELVCQFVLARLVEIGYPDEITNFKYDQRFPTRGLWFDKERGNLLNCDFNHNILLCTYGFKPVPREEIERIYPNAYVSFNKEKYSIMDSLFHLPVTFIVASLIDYFAGSKSYKIEDDGFVSSDNVFYSYDSIFTDVTTITDVIHNEPYMKKIICDHPERFIIKHPDTLRLLQSIKAYGNGVSTFLLTNSSFNYTDSVMKFVLDGKEDWKQLFDYIVVDACKPKFFEQQCALRKFDEGKRTRLVGQYRGPLEKNRIYSGGSCEVFTRLIGASGNDILYIGDHLYGDVIRSKKQQRQWRTFMVLPELEQELRVLHRKQELYDRIDELYSRIDKVMKTFDIRTSESLMPNISSLNEEIRACYAQVNKEFGCMGSLLRKGARLTLLAVQVSRYADIYASSATKLVNYPLFHLFIPPPLLMPHEMTVDRHEPYNEITEHLVGSHSAIMASDGIGGTTPHPHLNKMCRKNNDENCLNGVDEKNGIIVDRHNAEDLEEVV